MNACLVLQTSGSSGPIFPLITSVQSVSQIDTSLEFKRGGAGLEDVQGRDLAARQEAELDDIQKHFLLSERAAVKTLLLEHRAFPQLLLESVVPLRKHFGADILLRLAAPLDESGSRTLCVVALWPGTVQHVRLANAWFKEMSKADPTVLLKLASAVSFLRSVTTAFTPKPGEVNAAGVNLAGFEHVAMLLNVDDRMRAGFTQREIDEIRRQEDQLRADAASRARTA